MLSKKNSLLNHITEQSKIQDFCIIIFCALSNSFVITAKAVKPSASPTSKEQSPLIYRKCRSAVNCILRK